MNKTMLFILVVFSLPLLANTTSEHMALECVLSTGNQVKDITIAVTKAKGKLARDLRGMVTSSSILEAISEEGAHGLIQKDHLIEKTTITASVLLKGVQTVASYTKNINGQKHYCVELKI